MGQLMDRRAFLAAAAAAAVTVATGCDSGGSDVAEATSSASAATTAATTTTASPSCVLTPELTDGPYYLDVDQIRRDITEDRLGVQTTVAVTLVRMPGCTPLADVPIDLWHADAEGHYSGVAGQPGDDGDAAAAATFLRGTQVTDRAGLAEFVTIFPGWYPGRVTHMHLKAHLDGEREVATQLFFPAEITSDVYASGLYADRGEADTSLAEDMVIGGDAADLTALTLRVTRAGDGLTGTIVLGVRGESGSGGPASASGPGGPPPR